VGGPAAGPQPPEAVGAGLSPTRAQLTVSPMRAEDWPAVARIYAEGIAGGDASFESHVPDWERWSAEHLADPCLCARGPSQEVLGWAALGLLSTRPAYRGVAEVSIYVERKHARRGVGRALLSALIEASERAGFWTLEARIFPENAASLALHEGCGFQLVGARKRVGAMPDGRWRDELLYERRSTAVGQD
jgi:L-amino acid N-acyltransferase YncA